MSYRKLRPCSVDTLHRVSSIVPGPARRDGLVNEEPEHSLSSSEGASSPSIVSELQLQQHSVMVRGDDSLCVFLTSVPEAISFSATTAKESGLSTTEISIR